MPLCRHFSRVCHSSSQALCTSLAPGHGQRKEQLSRAISQSSIGGESPAPQLSTGYWDGLSPLLQSQHTPRSPSLSNSSQIWPWICMDASDWGTGSWLAQNLGRNRARRSAQGFTQTSHLLLPLTHQPGLGPDAPLCCSPGWEPAPRVPSGHEGG